jgi:hypothetical protein
VWYYYGPQQLWIQILLVKSLIVCIKLFHLRILSLCFWNFVLILQEEWILFWLNIHLVGYFLPQILNYNVFTYPLLFSQGLFTLLIYSFHYRFNRSHCSQVIYLNLHFLSLIDFHILLLSQNQDDLDLIFFSFFAI